jgi:hypothetical protein
MTPYQKAFGKVQEQILQEIARGLGIPGRPWAGDSTYSSILLPNRREVFMTEQEWLTSTDPQAMLIYIRMNRWHGPGPAVPPFVPAFEDAAMDRKLRLACHALMDHTIGYIPDDYPTHPQHWLAGWISAEEYKGEPAGQGSLCRILRDLFNPFRLSALCGVTEGVIKPADCVTPHCPNCREILAWRDGTIVTLAREIYEERCFERLPILADALEEAGCTCEELIRHCRGWVRCLGRNGSTPERPIRCERHGIFAACPRCQGTGWIQQPNPRHWRGCWVLDLLLGKE